MPYSCRRCRRVLLVVLSLLIGTRSRLLVVGLLSIAEAMYPSQCFFRTIVVTLCFDGVGLAGFKSRANAFLLAWSAFSYCLLLFYLFLPSMGWLCGVGVFGLIECSHYLPALHNGLQLIILIIIHFLPVIHCLFCFVHNLLPVWLEFLFLQGQVCE